MPQEQIQKQGRPSVRTAPKEPKQYNVFILNDDFTTFEFVIMVIMTVFQKSQSQAELIAETTHTKQRALIGSYSLDIARSKVDKATEMARAEDFPLRFEIIMVP